MNIIDANFIVNQLNPLLKKTHWYMNRLKLDPENEDIEVCNLMGAIFYRVHYPDYRMADGIRKIMEEVYG